MINLLVILGLIFGMSNSLKVDIKTAIFSSYDGNLRSLGVTPSELVKAGFRVDNSSKRNDFPVIFDKVSRYKILNFESNPIEVQRLILSFSSGLSKGGCGVFSFDAVKTVEWVSRNNGCCSDFSQAFLLVATINGLFAREVSHNSHTFNEYYDETLHKWVWVDANFKLMALGRDSIYLNLIEIRELFLQGKQPKWVFFGNDEQRFFKNSAGEHKYFKANEFQNLRFNNGNNVLEQGYWLSKFLFFPKEVRQFVFLSLGIMPKEIFYADSEYIVYFRNLKIMVNSIFLTLLIVNLFILRRPMLSLFTSFLKWRSKNI